MKNESFIEQINGRANAGDAVLATVEGRRFVAHYVRPILSKPHRCRLYFKDDNRKRYFTVSTRKVAFT